LKLTKKSKPNKRQPASPRRTSRGAHNAEPAKYDGPITVQLAAEMLSRAAWHLATVPCSPLAMDSVEGVEPPFLNDDASSHFTTLEAMELLGQKAAHLSPNIREIILPQRYPNTPNDQPRRAAYAQSLNQTVMVLREIMETSAAECGEEFQHEVRNIILERLTGDRTSRPGDKATREENQKMIAILHKISQRCSQNPKELKEIAPDGRDPQRWAKVQATQLNRFGDRVYRVWDALGHPQPASWAGSTCSQAFWTECSLRFPEDTCVTWEVIKKAQKRRNARRLKAAQKHARRHSQAPKQTISDRQHNSR
jgi:hypothetical protein